MRLKKKALFLIPILLILLSAIDGLLTLKNFNKVKGSIKVYDNREDLLYESITDSDGYQTPIRLDEIDVQTINAVLSAEDNRFYKHFGIDVISLSRALIENIDNKAIRYGGSTITQQSAKQNLAFTHTNIYLRKIRSLNSSVYLEVFLSKKSILEHYVNNIYFGNNSYGIQAASLAYFNKPAKYLSLAESATLAASIKAPNILNPTNTDIAVQERNKVLDLMHKNGYLSDQELTQTKEYPLGLNTNQRVNKHLHVVDYAMQKAKEILEQEDLSGYKIYTTTDSAISEHAVNAARIQVGKLKEDHKLSNAASVVLSTKDSAILAMEGSIDYFNEEIDGAVNVTTSLRQPGSALKPFTYGQAFYEGLLKSEDIIIDEKTTFTDKDGKSYVPHNYNGKFNGPVTARVALASSLNLPAVKVLEMVGVEDMISAVKNAGVTSLNEPKRYDLSVTLGGGEVKLLDLANAYNSLARGGYYLEPYIISKIENHKGETVYTHETKELKPIWGSQSKYIAELLTDILSDKDAKVLGFGRNNVLNLPFKAASKTGTTTDWHDNFVYGYTDDFTVGVWVGNSDNSSMYAIDGVTGAGPIWREIMLKTQKILSRNSLDITQEEEELFDNGRNDQKIVEISNHITNPANNSLYTLNEVQEPFERIEFEVTTNNEINIVEYILNGSTKYLTTKEDSFKYVWAPFKGTHTLEAIFYNNQNKIISKDISVFTIN